MASRSEGMRVTVLGARGSTPVSGSDFSVFGGNTSCYLVEAGETSLILDAGSGLINAPVTFAHPPAILLSHLHVDHLLGLGMYGRITQPEATTMIYVPASDAQDAQDSLAHLYAPPLWPVQLHSYSGNLTIDALPRAMRYGEIQVETMSGNHPGGCVCIKLRFVRKSVVYATDFEHGVEASTRLAEFSRNADLLLYDAQYDEDDYEAHRGFGHSTAREGIKLMERCGAKRLLLIHHDPRSTDETLLGRERALGCQQARYAREGETIEL